MAQDDAERTEDPTPKRREDARRRGEVAQSRDVATVLMMAASLFGLATFVGDDVARSLAIQAREMWSGAALQPHGLGDFHALFLHHLVAAAQAMAPMFLVLVTVAVLAHVVQIGPLFTVEALAFKGSRLDPLKGLRKMFSLDRVVDLPKALLKLAVVVAAAVWVMRPALGEILALGAVPLAGIFGPMRRLILELSAVALAALGLLAVLDLLWVRHRHEKNLRMTRKEVRDEAREREGSPQMKSRMRRMQLDLSRQRMIAEVARADVVVINPTHYAVALRYAAGEMAAPVVLAMGRNHVAQRIREAARRHTVPVFENPPLARLLYRTAKVGQEVPANLYRAVAEVLAYVYRLDPRKAAAWSHAS